MNADGALVWSRSLPLPSTHLSLSIMSQPLISIHRGVARHPQYRLAAPYDFSIAPRQHAVIYGPNGSGKTMLAQQISGARALLGDAYRTHFAATTEGPLRLSECIRCISFRSVYGGAEPAYYQQRWNRADEQPFPSVAELLQRSRAAADHEPDAEVEQWVEATGILAHLDKPINLLSSGELRRLQTARMLYTRPQLLVIDNPYIGLDKEARATFARLLRQLAERLTLIVVVSRIDDIPPFTRQVVSMDCGHVVATEPYADFMARATTCEATAVARVQAQPVSLPPCPSQWAARQEEAATEKAAIVAHFDHVSVCYDGHYLLRDIDWQVKRGEHWALTGPNGAGKSTLLSLVCADNPQAYATPITLFGHRRGSGESIWDIKKHIGYVAPELFTTYHKSLPAIDIAASGLHDTIGLYKRVTDSERDHCSRWLQTFGCGHLANRDYLSLSEGEQRLILLVRAFVKHPSLLILDEPFHGLDAAHRALARAVIEAYMQQADKTLIMVTHYPEELPPCIDHHLRLERAVLS